MLLPLLVVPSQHASRIHFRYPCRAAARVLQVRSHHFCSHRNEEMRQCIIYDSGAPDARLIGVEYIISRRLYEGLPAEERQYWHSHVYEVARGCPTTELNNCLLLFSKANIGREPFSSGDAREHCFTCQDCSLSCWLCRQSSMEQTVPHTSCAASCKWGVGAMLWPSSCWHH